jgi:dTMP kinase
MAKNDSLNYAPQVDETMGWSNLPSVEEKINTSHLPRAYYICIEGIDGVGKSTQAKLLSDFFRQKRFAVLHTKEPGTDLLPVTMELRKLMLDSKHNITPLAREYIAQAIRSIHMEKLIIPAIKNMDIIIQDRGILSALAYGKACGVDMALLNDMCQQSTNYPELGKYLYDRIIYLRKDPEQALAKTVCKKEFEAGDVMEKKGSSFMEEVQRNMDILTLQYGGGLGSAVITIDVGNKDIDTVFYEIMYYLAGNVRRKSI